MNYYKQKHRVLKTLAFESSKFLIDEKSLLVRGISYTDLLLKLKLSERDLNIIISELYENKEIKEVEKGLIIEKLGLASYTNKKYLRIYKNYLITNLKDIVQIIIPILTSIIAIIAVSNNNQNKLEKKIEQIEKFLKSKENNTK